MVSTEDDPEEEIKQNLDKGKWIKKKIMMEGDLEEGSIGVGRGEGLAPRLLAFCWLLRSPVCCPMHILLSAQGISGYPNVTSRYSEEKCQVRSVTK